MITPSESATFLVLCLIVAIAALVSPIEKRWKPPVWAAVGLGSVALVLSMTRSAWSGLIIGTIAVVAQTRRRFAVKVGLLGALSLIVGVGLIIAWAGVSKRVEAAGDDWNIRWNLNLIAWEMIKANPVVGVGLNNATQVVHRYAPLAALTLNQWGAAWIFIPHNQFLLVTAETGIPGLLAFIWMLWSSLRAARFSARSSDPFISEAGSILVAMHLALFWALNLDFVAGAQTYVFLWFLMGSSHGLRRCAEEEAAGEPALAPGRRRAAPLAPARVPQYQPTLTAAASQSSWMVSR
jgi:O-antigen ligase